MLFWAVCLFLPDAVTARPLLTPLAPLLTLPPALILPAFVTLPARLALVTRPRPGATLFLIGADGLEAAERAGLISVPALFVASVALDVASTPPRAFAMSDHR